MYPAEAASTPMEEKGEIGLQNRAAERQE